MTKILYIVSTLKSTGPTNQLYNIVRYGDNQNYSYTILTLSPEPNDSKIDDFKKLGVRVDTLNLSRVKGVIKGKKLVIKYVNQNKPDIIHTQGIRPDTMVVDILDNYSKISTLRNYPWDDYPLKFGKFKGSILARRHLKTISKSKKIITCSRSLKEEFYNKNNFDFEYIQNGVDTEKYYSPTTEETENLKIKLGVPKDKVIFISVGSIIPRKDPINLVKGFLNSEESNKSLLYIIGEGPLISELNGLIKNHDNVILCGKKNNVADYLKVADYFISTSLSEGLPNTVLEAMASGLPVCLSDISSHTEILDYNSEAGIITPLQDSKVLSSSINNMLKADYKKMSASALDIINQHLSAEKMSNKYHNAYYKLKNS